MLSLIDGDAPMTPNAVRSALSIVLLCCYDRRVEREFMAEMLDLSARIDITMAKLETAAQMHFLLGMIEKEKQPEGLNASIEEWVGNWVTLRKQLADKFRLVTEMATASDPIS